MKLKKLNGQVFAFFDNETRLLINEHVSHGVGMLEPGDVLVTDPALVSNKYFYLDVTDKNDWSKLKEGQLSSSSQYPVKFLSHGRFKFT